MKVLILGSGMMGPAAAYNAIRDAEVSQVTICDISQAQLDSCMGALAGKSGFAKLIAIQRDLSDEPAAAALLADYDVAVAALPRPENQLAIRAALKSGTPLVDLSSAPPEFLSEMAQEADTAGRFVILGCGVEPGLTEIMARHLSEGLDRVNELHIKCGGIPEKPQPPLGYKIVFGGRRMPLRNYDSTTIVNGELREVPRYSGVEAVTFPGVGECEAWHEGLVPGLLKVPALRELTTATQKTVRWPGYASKISVLKEMGLLSTDPVLVNGVPVVPKQLLDAVLYPRVKMEEGERDITCFRVEVKGEVDGRPVTLKAEMVDRYDNMTNFTSMARTTAFTGAIVARMIAAGELTAGNEPFVTPEQVIIGGLFDRLLSELAAENVTFEITRSYD